MSKLRPRRLNISAGFTLIEILVAITVFAIMSVLSYSGLHSLLETRAHTLEQAEQMADLQLAMSILARDLRLVTPRTSRDQYGDVRPGLSKEGGDSSPLEFIRGGWRNPLGLQRSQLQRVAYHVDDQKLIRSSWATLDLAPQSEPTEIVLLEGVNSFSVEFLDDKGTATNTWPAQSSLDSEPTAGLPKGIKITLDVEPWGEILRVFGLAG